MGRLEDEVARLRARLEARSAERSILEIPLRESGLSAPEWHCRRALARASQFEWDEIERLLEEENEPEYLRSWEEVLRREAPTLADNIRCRRDALWCQLERLSRELEAQGRHRSTWYSDPAYWAVVTAAVNRRTVIHRGAEPMEDAEEARSIVERISNLSPGSDPAEAQEEIFGLIGWAS